MVSRSLGTPLTPLPLPCVCEVATDRARQSTESRRADQTVDREPSNTAVESEHERIADRAKYRRAVVRDASTYNGFSSL